MTRRAAASCVLGAILAGILLARPVVAATPEDEWPTYHHDAARSGVDPTAPDFSDVEPSWTSESLDGDIYAEPLYVGDRVLVATENNSVYALDGATGEIVWQSQLDPPAQPSQTGCTNIRPVEGITSTPVVDEDTQTLYTVALVGTPLHYELYALKLEDGSVRFHRSLLAAGLTERFHQQRGALGLANGRVYIPFGGYHGDCLPYHGRIVAASISDASAPLLQYVVPGDRGGIWAAGGSTFDDDGSLYVATGNGVGANFDDRSQSVIHLSDTLDELGFWTAGDLPNLNENDIDIGSLAPTLLPDMRLIFQAGKNSYGYLLTADNLGGVGGDIFQSELLPNTSGPDICAGAWGGAAYVSPVVYLSCGTRTVALRVGPRGGDATGKLGFTVMWAGPDQVKDVQQGVGSPIVAGGAVWEMDFHQHLMALDAGTGEVRFQGDLPGVPAHFATPTSGGGRIYAAAGHQVVAFALLAD